jgi:hypothetical protein
MTYGISAGGTGENVYFHWREPISTFFKTLARLLAFSSYEINRFIGIGSARQIVFLQDHWWLIPPVLFVWLVGFVHPVWMAVTAFRRTRTHTEWPVVRALFIATVLLASSSFFFTVAWAQSTSFSSRRAGLVLMRPTAGRSSTHHARRLAAVVLSVNLVVQSRRLFPGCRRAESVHGSTPLDAGACRADARPIANRRPGDAT